MIILISNLSSTCEKKDIERLIQSSISKFFWFSTDPSIHVNLYNKKYLGHSQIEYFALVCFSKERNCKKTYKEIGWNLF